MELINERLFLELEAVTDKIRELEAEETDETEDSSTYF